MGFFNPINVSGSKLGGGVEQRPHSTGWMRGQRRGSGGRQQPFEEVFEGREIKR
jgi:hypothetical protein